MADLILLTVADQEPVRCVTVADAEALARNAEDEPIILTIIPDGGGPVTTLQCRKSESDWFSEN